VVSKIGTVVVIFFACVGKIFGAIPDQTGSVGVFYNVVVLRLCVVRKMCYKALKSQFSIILKLHKYIIN